RLPDKPAPWHMPGTFYRFPLAVLHPHPITIRRPIVIAEPHVPHDLMQIKTFAVIEVTDAGERPAGLAERDMDWNLVFLATPSQALERTYYFYPSNEPPSEALKANDQFLGNGL